MTAAERRWPGGADRGLIAVLALVAILVVVVLLATRGPEHAARPAALSVTTAAPATPPPLSLVRYENPDYPYEIRYPDGWIPVTTDSGHAIFRGPGGRQIEISVQTIPGEKMPSLPAYADAQVQMLRAKLANPVKLQRQRLGLANQQAGIEVDLSWTGAAGPGRALLLYALDGNIAFALRADAPAGAFATERRLLETSLRSFSLTPSD